MRKQIEIEEGYIEKINDMATQADNNRNRKGSFNFKIKQRGKTLN